VVLGDRISRNDSIMGKRRKGKLLNALGSATTELPGAAAVGLLVSCRDKQLNKSNVLGMFTLL
jgi:hypothetical protein